MIMISTFSFNWKFDHLKLKLSKPKENRDCKKKYQVRYLGLVQLHVLSYLLVKDLCFTVLQSRGVYFLHGTCLCQNFGNQLISSQK